MEQTEQFKDFYKLCRVIGEHFDKEWKEADEWEKEIRLEREKKAIMGYQEETEYYKRRIEEVLESSLH